MPVFKEEYLTNKDFLKYYYKDIGFIEEQFYLRVLRPSSWGKPWMGSCGQYYGGQTYTM
jgi:hypothetical protein